MVKNLLISAGHSKLTPGATDKDGKLNGDDEWEMNVFQAKVLQRELKLLGIEGVDIYDPEVDNKFDIGKHALGYKLFIDLHLNAFNGKDYYTCCKVDERYSSPKALATLIASDFAKAIADAIGNKVYEQKIWPRGIMPGKLEVLSGAGRTGTPAFLSEAFFIDAYDAKAEIEARCEKAMKAAAKVLIRYLK